MNKHITFEDLAVRNEAGCFSPAKLSTLKRVFVTVCKEVAIPVGAESEREVLAQKLITAGATSENESWLLEFARNAVTQYRRQPHD